MREYNYIYPLILESGPVIELQISSPDDSTLIISWKPPTDSNGIILAYSVMIFSILDGTVVRNNSNYDAGLTNFTENGLGMNR